MRIRYRNEIKLCTKASHSGRLISLYLSGNGKTCRVTCVDEQQAKELFGRLLAEGWLNLNAKSLTVEGI